MDTQGKLFCVQLTEHANRTSARNFWCTPGGGLDENEDILAGLRREMIEETGIAPVVGSLLYIQQFIDSGDENLEFFFHVINSDDYKNIDFSASSHGIEEIANADFVDPKSTHILPKFLSTENIAEHIKSRQPTKIFNYL